MTDTAKLRAGVTHAMLIDGSWDGTATTNALMRQAADEIDGLRRENARIEALLKLVYDREDTSRDYL